MQGFIVLALEIKKNLETEKQYKIYFIHFLIIFVNLSFCVCLFIKLIAKGKVA